MTAAVLCTRVDSPNKYD